MHYHISRPVPPLRIYDVLRKETKLHWKASLGRWNFGSRQYVVWKRDIADSYDNGIQRTWSDLWIRQVKECYNVENECK